MKKKRFAIILLCILALAAMIYLGCVSGSFPDTASPEELGVALGAVSLLPIVVAVGLSFITGNVILSLLMGYIVGVVMLTVLGGSRMAEVPGQILSECCSGIIATISEPSNASVLVLCIAVGGLVEVLRSVGGFDVIAHRLERRINSPRKANLLAQLFCMLFFFDDYANALISGPVLQPMMDRAGLSRERLSYIVDSTAAPLAGIAVISSWVAVEVSVIDEGLTVAGLEISGFELFLRSIPYCFYCVFCMVCVLETTLLNREYGPMLQAEQRARRAAQSVKAKRSTASESASDEKNSRRVFVCAFCTLLLFVTALLSFYTQGRGAAEAAGKVLTNEKFSFALLSTVLAHADTIFLILCAVMLCTVTAVILAQILAILPVKDGISSWLKGAEELMPTLTILLLAWSLAETVKDLGTVYYVVEIISAGVPHFLVPTLIFVCCCLISFASGSYGCMFMVMPMAIPVASAVMGAENMRTDSPFLLLCVAAVLSGSIFGDHCSPMTDCTVLAALGSGCEIMDHVKTQLPYALTVSAVTVVFGTLLTALGVSVWVSLLLGCAALALIIFFVGRRPEQQ